MASGMSCGDGGGFGSGSRSSSSAEFSQWHLREAEGSDVVTGTLKHCDNFTRYDELRSWDPTNFLMLQNGSQRTRQGIGLEPETCFCRSWRYTKSPTSIRGKAWVVSGGPWSAHCTGGWHDAVMVT